LPSSDRSRLAAGVPLIAAVDRLDPWRNIRLEI
jgi:hypothetical protein